jgi:hypothetical protein
VSKTKDPNPPSRKNEDFPKTNTFPDGWVMDSIMERYNSAGSVYDRGETDLNENNVPVPATGTSVGKVNGKSHPVEQAPAHEPEEAENLFNRRLEPFLSTQDVSRMWL